MEKVGYTITRLLVPTLCALIALLLLFGCTEADRVSQNIAKEADNFNVVRRVVVINGRTEGIVFECIGKMSISTKDGNRLDLIIEGDDGEYYKHILLLPDESYVSVEDVGGSSVSKFKYEVNFLPEMIQPFTITNND